jgi:dihydrofolate reductase
MGKVIVNEFLSLDCVAQAPGGQDEDPSGGFAHGGWHMPFIDDVARRWILEPINGASGFLLGRRTYEIFAAYWPNAPAEVQEFAVPLNTKPKYVASRTLSEPLAWQNSRLLKGNLAEAVRNLKQGEGGDILVIGSTILVQSLIENDLVDEYRLMIDPLLLGAANVFSAMTASCVRCALPTARSRTPAQSSPPIPRQGPNFQPPGGPVVSSVLSSRLSSRVRRFSPLRRQ